MGKPMFVDIKMVEKLYGEDGFGGSITPPLKVGYYTSVHGLGINPDYTTLGSVSVENGN